MEIFLENVTKPYLTPLLLAIVNQCPSSFEIAKILLEHGAEVAPIDRDGLTPLHRAAVRGMTRERFMKKCNFQIGNFLPFF